MLGYLVRTLPMVARAKLATDKTLISRLERRVTVGETDFNLHMNQAAYAQVMELGRLDWFLRSGAYDHYRAEGIRAVVAEQTIIYRRELKTGQRYWIDTRAVGVDGRLLVFEGHMAVGDRVHAKAVVKLIFIGAHGVLGADETMRLSQPLVCDALRVDKWMVQGGA